MAISKEKADQLLKELEKQQEELFKAKNLDGVVGLYHPDAILIHKGGKAAYGREEIKKTLEPFMHLTEPFKTDPYYASASDDGDYLIRRMTYTIGDNPRKFEIEQIYKKTGGKYLIYHDEFEFSQ